MAVSEKSLENLKNGKRFSSTYQPDNSGRKTNKIDEILIDEGYSAEDARRAYLRLGFKTIKQAREIAEDESQPGIVRIVAQQYVAAYDEEDYNKVKDIMSHVLPRQEEIDLVQRMISDSVPIPLTVSRN